MITGMRMINNGTYMKVARLDNPKNDAGANCGFPERRD